VTEVTGLRIESFPALKGTHAEARIWRIDVIGYWIKDERYEKKDD